jgi:SAM-dependent methyltransferase
VPAGAERVLEVGCGAGALAGELAVRAGQVDAFDRDPAMVALARSRVPANVAVLEADALTVDLPVGGYDAVVSMSVLHHLPLAPALQRMAGWLRPGGVLTAIALPRIDVPVDVPVELVALAGHRLLGTAFAAGRAVTGRPLFGYAPDVAAMPMRDPELTTRQVRAQAQVLPGARVRRLVFWRYELSWTRPADQAPVS